MRRSRFALIIVGALVASTFSATFGSTAAQAATVTIPAGTPYGCSISGTYDIDDVTGVAFSGGSCTGTLILDPRVTSIGGGGFFNARDLKSLTLDSALRSVGFYAFYGAPLTSLTLPPDSALESIDFGAFGSALLTSLDLSPASALTSIGLYAFAFAPLTSLTLDSALVTIGSGAFNIAALTCFTNPSSASLTSTGLQTFTALPHCAVPDNGAAQRAAALAAEQAAAAAKAMQDQALVLGTLALAIGSIESGLSTLTVAATQKQGVGTHKVSKKLKKKAKTKK